MCSLAGVMAGVQFGAQIAQGAAANKAAKANAIQAQNEARYAQQSAVAEAEQIRYNNQRDIGTFRAAFGARGVAGDSASLVDVIAEAAGNLDYAALVKEHEGQLARYHGDVQAKRMREAGRNAMYESILGGVVGFASQGIRTDWWAGKGIG
ncbi:MAG: hypothetical protein SGI91_04485 [Alphaproteobacteria bacterium]|nr:hypothetical protein [Alphaproteobacteria bacterium]